MLAACDESGRRSATRSLAYASALTGAGPLLEALGAGARGLAGLLSAGIPPVA